MDWQKIESILGEPLPECVKKLLSLCGYDSFGSLRKIDTESILQIQRQVNTYFRHNIRELSCCHSDFYKIQTDFEFLPGHRDLILALPEYLQVKSVPTVDTQSTAFTTVMNSMVQTAQQNADRDRNQYDDVIRFFSTYTFLLCGRSCYEFLNQNLPLPSTKTVCKYLQIGKCLR